MDDSILICIRKDNYRHHNKIVIGETYLGYKTDSGWRVSDINNKYIGWYNLNQFLEISEWRNSQLDKLFKFFEFTITLYFRFCSKPF